MTKQQLLSTIIIAAVTEFTVVSSYAGGQAWAPRSVAYQSYIAKSFRSAVVSSQSWDDVARLSSSPKAICAAVQGRVRYTRDMVKEDEWRDGRDTWERGEGDCEDFAAAIKDLCDKKGFKTEIYILKSETARAAHAVTIGEINGSMWISSNGSFEYVQSLDDAKDLIARDLGWHGPDVGMYKVNKSSGNKAYQVIQTADYIRR